MIDIRKWVRHDMAEVMNYKRHQSEIAKCVTINNGNSLERYPNFRIYEESRFGSRDYRCLAPHAKEILKR